MSRHFEQFNAQLQIITYYMHRIFTKKQIMNAKIRISIKVVLCLYFINTGGLNAQGPSKQTPLRIDVGAGVFVYQGDLTPNITGSWRTMQPGLAVSVRKQLTPHVQLLSGITLARLEGDDSKYKNEPAFRGERRFAFTSTLAEAGFQVQWFLRRQNADRLRFSPFLQAGGA